jgi:membrane protease YdiL (CAAX protease family)
VKNWSVLLLKRNIDEVPWTIWQTFSGICWTLIPYMSFSLLSLLSTPPATHPAKQVPISPQIDFINAIAYFIYAIIGEGVFLLAPLFFAKRTSFGDMKSILRNLGFRRFDVKRVLPLIILLFLAFILLNYLYQLLITTFHLPLQTNDQVILERGRATPLSMYAILLGAAVIAPVCEEAYFRSFVFMGFLRRLPVWIAIVLSSFLFALIHLDPASFAVLFCIGLVLAFLRWYSNSIWPGIILHTLNNATSGLVIILTLHNILKP